MTFLGGRGFPDPLMIFIEDPHGDFPERKVRNVLHVEPAEAKRRRGVGLPKAVGT